MKCTHARGLFGSYWDDEITQAEREWLEAHFATCAGCREEYESYARALEALGSLPRLEAAPDLAERVLERARRVRSAPDRITWTAPAWVPATAAAAVVLLVAGTLVPWLAVRPRVPAQNPPVASVVTTPSTTGLSEPPAEPAARVAVPRLTLTRAAQQAPALKAGAEQVATIPDSLFDHSEDVEFILDPVTLRRGRPAVTRPVPVQGQQATITF